MQVSTNFFPRDRFVSLDVAVVPVGFSSVGDHNPRYMVADPVYPLSASELPSYVGGEHLVFILRNLGNGIRGSLPGTCPRGQNSDKKHNSGEKM